MTRTYSQVGDQLRLDLVKLIAEQKFTIRDAAKQLEINYENAKAIYRTFRMQKRINKIKYRRNKEAFEGPPSVYFTQNTSGAPVQVFNTMGGATNFVSTAQFPSHQGNQIMMPVQMPMQTTVMAPFVLQNNHSVEVKSTGSFSSQNTEMKKVDHSPIFLKDYSPQNIRPVTS